MQAQTQGHRFLDGVRTYYDKNTPRFVRSHPSAVANAIHREVWGPGVQGEKEAFEYVNSLVLRSITAIAGSFPSPMQVLDLGCGVGGTLFYLAGRTPIEGLGITLSPVGVRLAESLAREAGLSVQCRFLETNYLELPDVGARHAVYAIESFLHGPDAGRFFQSAAAVIPRGGRLIICDDFLTEGAAASTNRKDKRNLSDFRRGWHVGTLITTRQAEIQAENAGLRLVDNQDLTPYLRLRRPCDRMIAMFVNLGRGLPFRSPWWDSWVGGHAIQRCLLTGLIEYHFLVFEKVLD
ncbi:MAG: methyltransferase domain-containing protein [Candidatus Korobacteraceae bacterium]